MTMPKISVLMPCHNSARWLRQAMESVLGQSMTALELIVVDNGSTDDTVAIVDGYAGRDPRISILKQGDFGPAIARNRARGVAKGEWIATLDSDDIAEPSRLEKQLAFASSRANLVLLGTGFIDIDPDGARRGEYAYPQDDNALRGRLARLQGFFPHSSAFYSRAVAERLGGYRVEVGYAEDWDFWLRLAEIGHLGCLPESLVQIRKHPSQMSQESGGRIQQIHACAAAVAHFLRLAGHADPISAAAPARGAYLRWVEDQMDALGYFEQRLVWTKARARALSGRSRIVGLAGFAMDLARSPYAVTLLRDKLMGSDLPRRLAAKWQ